MRLTALSLTFAAAASAALFSTAAPAADAQCTSLDTVVLGFQGQGANVFMIPTERLAAVAQDTSLITGDSYEGVTRAFIAQGKGSVVLGLEVGGCLLDPIFLAQPERQAFA